MNRSIQKRGLALALALAMGSVHAQSTTGSIVGSVGQGSGTSVLVEKQQRSESRSAGGCTRSLHRRQSAAGHLQSNGQARWRRGGNPRERRHYCGGQHRRLVRRQRCGERRADPGQRHRQRCQPDHHRRQQRGYAYRGHRRTVAATAAGPHRRSDRVAGTGRGGQQRRLRQRPARRLVAQLRRLGRQRKCVLPQRLQHHHHQQQPGRPDPCRTVPSTSRKSSPAATARSTAVPTAV